MKMYTLEACEKLLEIANARGWDIEEKEEGVLGLGLVVLYDATTKTRYTIKERYLNEWSSGHTVTKRRIKEEKICTKYKKSEYDSLCDSCGCNKNIH